MGKVEKNMGVNGGVVDNFLELDPNEIYVPEGRFRPLDKKAVKVIEESIEKNGQLQPIIVDRNGNIIDGNHRLHACINLGISVIAKVVDEVDENKIALMEIDTNLCRKELTQTELENHLAERKRIYLKLFPDTAKGSFTKTDKKSFTEDTADTLGVSKKTVERLVKRGEEATDELKQARDNKEITNSELDEIIKDTSGLSVEDKNKALKEKLKAKAEQKEVPKPKEKEEIKEVKVKEEQVATVDGQEVSIGELQKLNGILEESFVEVNKLNEALKAKVAQLETLLTKEKESNSKLRDRIKKAKEANPDIKI